ncbi:DNA polymerase III subunit gamma/tau [Microbacterium sp. P01]|uniref:DNA polymerase III subunit gamma/tau n=1 Tax=Microbacterium sp. P01 TaxID=3366261 RepID=UPI003671C015
MTAGRDDDALSWDGDDDPTLVTGVDERDVTATAADAATDEKAAVEASDPVALPQGFDAVGRGSDEVGRLERDGTVTAVSEPKPLGNAALVGIGILSGIYLLWTIGWVVGGLRLQGTAQFLVAPVGYLVSLWLAILAPLIWFVTTLVLTRGSHTWVRVLWLLAGAILLVPWPFLAVGAVGQ